MSTSQLTVKKITILGVSIVLAALVLGMMMVRTVKTFKSYDNTVKVRGLCEREVPADRVVMRISYRMQDNDFMALRNSVAVVNEKIVSMLKKSGFDDDEIKYGMADYTDRYGNYYSDSDDKIRYRYMADQYINVFTSKVEDVEKAKSKIESELLKQNIIVSIYNSYEYNGLNEIKPSMIAESLENARNAADEFAKNSRSRIGKMRTASQGYFEVENLDENTPQIKKIRVVTTVEYYLK
ncbi:MAG: SIMPL domain-containing protein [Bacteroidales bacterium]|nr:SIMPL domain-containing protein [Bacteroidales bacterium]